MKLIDQFKTFLSSEVNLNDTRMSQLGASVEAVQKVIKTSSWGPKIFDFDAHGSWAHGTIIKPRTGGEFDADLLVIVEPVEGWEAKDYVNKLGAIFDGHSTYKDKVHRYSHCVTIEYVGERRIDVAPCVKGRLWSNTYEVCNRTTNEFETTAALEYTDWVVGRNGVAGGNDLKKVTRLLKYLRDIKTNFTCPSFLFTTLVGMHIYDSDKDTAAFADTPTCLKTLMGRLDDYLQAHPTVPVIRNPVLWSDIQSRAWDQTKYGNFREKINLYRTWIDEAFGEVDRDESIGKWQRVFGDSFAASEAKESARLSESISRSDSLVLASESMSGSEALVSASRCKDLVQRVIELGRAALPERITRLPYVQRPKWRAASQSYHVKVSAELLTEQKGRRLGPVMTLQPLPKGNSIRFTASNSVGLPFTSSFKVQWRVTNTDLAAYNANTLRGDFYASDSGFSREEDLAYRGVHFVEAFLIGKSDNRLYGKSEPFYVVIE
ncbi:nucleotidyltransferase [Pseudomonas asiatica]|uniref:SMODS domain-containing nucleotidyltransferase n=1 Tax=Pseudomonas asiatica TaxID=2219225 RepID=UPI00166ADE3E|nr:nucleotidyltransferase [Pseudomonas asiatica]QNT41745.1 nucleotidyltransferase [Pseudomonas asiatica]